VKRGDIVIATAPGFGKKPRPYVAIQANEYAALTTTILLPITTTLADPPSALRVRIVPSAANGLVEDSEVMTDIPVTARVERIHRHVGALAAGDMERVQEAMLLVLGFAG
jgi:mRNA interferase MazF